MTSYDNTTYHIYLKDNCVYWNLNEEDFEENLGKYLNQLGKAVVENIDL